MYFIKHCLSVTRKATLSLINEVLSLFHINLMKNSKIDENILIIFQEQFVEEK